MLYSIHIENIAIMDNVNLEFQEGFNVLTGQTGAGKSIIIDSVNLLTGERSSKELVRSGADKALVEGVLYTSDKRVYSALEESGIEYEEGEPLIISREISKDGRSVVRINNRVATTGLLKQICSKIINIHGQHDSQEILDEKSHLRFLDAFAKVEKELEEYKEAYLLMQECLKKIEETTQEDSLKEQKKELLEFAIKEIKEARLEAGEEEELKNTRSRFLNNEKIRNCIAQSVISLNGDENTKGARELLSNALDALNALAEFDTSVKEIAEKANDAYYMVDDICDSIRAISDIEENDVDINYIEERLVLIGRLKKKYGESFEEIMAKLAQMEEELDSIENSDLYLAKLKKNYAELKTVSEERALKLTNKRKEAAKIMEESVEKHLTDLEMPNVKFKVEISETELKNNGKDNVKFMISANKGEELKPLSKVASGGELARTILALKVVLADADTVSTMIFDEIDTGVSGSTSQKIAQKLKLLAKEKQVFVITHSPQIAAFADCHLFVEKTDNGEKTTSDVRVLNEEESIREIARIISGSTITDAAINAATELKKAGNNE